MERLIFGDVVFHYEEPFGREAQRSLSEQAEEAGWFLLCGHIRYEQHAWFRENQILEVLRIPMYGEVWFRNEEDLMAYKLRWL